METAKLMEAKHLLERRRGPSRLGARGSLPARLMGSSDRCLALLTEVKRHLPSRANGDLEQKRSGLTLNHPFNQLRALTNEGGWGCHRPWGLGFLIKEQVTAGQAQGAHYPSLRGLLVALGRECADTVFLI